MEPLAYGTEAEMGVWQTGATAEGVRLMGSWRETEEAHAGAEWQLTEAELEGQGSHGLMDRGGAAGVQS